MRETIATAMKDAMKARDSQRTQTLRLVVAAFKEKDIEVRGAGARPEASADELLAVMQKLVKQRQESAQIYADNGREDLAANERAEAAIIASFLPQALSEEETAAAVREAIAATGAVGIKDMGKAMAELRARHAGRMDFGKASALLKAALS